MKPLPKTALCQKECLNFRGGLGGFSLVRPSVRWLNFEFVFILAVRVQENSGVGVIQPRGFLKLTT